jgi:pimeloyl-ACP methyl ester carboxylesterase
MRRAARLFLTILASLLLVLIVAGVVSEQLGDRRDKTLFSQIGRSVDIGGRSLNIYCSGEGNPTVVLEGATGYGWMPIQRAIATFTRACWYDRAGYGWSDAGPRPRTSAAMATDLHEVLRAAAVPPPYVLVGASFNGFPVRVFAGRYLDEVAGVVLVDATHEDQREARSMLSAANKLPAPVRTALYTMVPVAGRVGLVRFMVRTTGARSPNARRPPPPGMTPDEARYFDFISGLPKSFVTSADEARNWEASAHEARTANNLGDRPLIVLTAGRGFVPDDPGQAADARAFHQVWVNELQPKLARLSSRGRQLIVEQSGHGIHFDAPDAVIGALREIIGEIRGEPRR